MISKELFELVVNRIVNGSIDVNGNKVECQIVSNNGCCEDFSINIYELAFRVRDYFKDKYNYELPMNGKDEETKRIRNV